MYIGWVLLRYRTGLQQMNAPTGKECMASAGNRIGPIQVELSPALEKAVYIPPGGLCPKISFFTMGPGVP